MNTITILSLGILTLIAAVSVCLASVTSWSATDLRASIGTDVVISVDMICFLLCPEVMLCKQLEAKF